MDKTFEMETKYNLSNLCWCALALMTASIGFELVGVYHSMLISTSTHSVDPSIYIDIGMHFVCVCVCVYSNQLRAGCVVSNELILDDN